jgi:hypothetical protein
MKPSFAGVGAVQYRAIVFIICIYFWCVWLKECYSANLVTEKLCFMIIVVVMISDNVYKRFQIGVYKLSCKLSILNNFTVILFL